MHLVLLSKHDYEDLVLGLFVLIVLGVGSLAAGFGVGLWWQDRDVSPKTARWVLTHSAQSAQLTPASAGLFTLTMSPADAQVIAVRQDDPGSSELIPARRLENEWQTMFGEESITVTLLVHDATTDADPDAASAETITLLAADLPSGLVHAMPQPLPALEPPARRVHDIDDHWQGTTPPGSGGRVRVEGKV